MNKVNNKDLSIVIIGHNEEKNIDRTINAINNLKLDGLLVEIIYIDSNSTDDSIYLLKQYNGINVYKIQANRYTASLARFVGSNIAKGKYILFLDGDMEIEKDTDINFCINTLQNNNDIGLISGKLPEFWYKDEKVINKIKDRYNVRHEIESLSDPGGYFIVSNKLLKDVGNFNIELSCNEEIDLFSRIKKIKPMLVRSNKISCIHHFYMNDGSKNYLNRFSKGYYSFFWVTLLNSIKNKNLKYYFGFNTQVKTLRSTMVTLLITITLLLSINNKLLIIIPITYYIALLIKKKFDIKTVNYNQINNILRLISIIFIFKNKQIIYKVEKIETFNAKGENT